MVYDSISYLNTYLRISEDIRIGLEWLHDINFNEEVGVYQLNPRVKAIVSEYTTKHENEYGYEAHRQYIDIQYLINGREKICSLPLEYLKETKAYNEENDAAFYKEESVRPQELLLGDGYFSIFFPQDGHMPQLCVDKPEQVKKVVIKVKLGYNTNNICSI